jgi:hypothetical protein
MSKLRDLEKLLTHLENRTDRTDRSPFRQFCQSAPLDMREVFSSGGSRMDRPAVPPSVEACVRVRKSENSTHA